MENSTKAVLVAGGAVALAIAYTANKYKQAAEALQVQFSGFYPQAFQNGRLYFVIRVDVLNASAFSYPVPRANMDFFVRGKYVGTASVLQFLTIGGKTNVSIDLHGSMSASESIIAAITMAANKSLPDEIFYTGEIMLGKYTVPFSSNYTPKTA